MRFPEHTTALGRDIGVADATDSDQEAAEKFLKAVESLVNELDTPTLEQFGINKEEFFNVIDKMAHDAMDSGSPQNTMRDVTEEEVKEVSAISSNLVFLDSSPNDEIYDGVKTNFKLGISS